MKLINAFTLVYSGEARRLLTAVKVQTQKFLTHQKLNGFSTTAAAKLAIEELETVVPALAFTLQALQSNNWSTETVAEKAGVLGDSGYTKAVAYSQKYGPAVAVGYCLHLRYFQDVLKYDANADPEWPPLSAAPGYTQLLSTEHGFNVLGNKQVVDPIMSGRSFRKAYAWELVPQRVLDGIDSRVPAEHRGHLELQRYQQRLLLGLHHKWKPLIAHLVNT